MVAIIFRTLIIYVFVAIMLRVMGKRQLGELEVEELVSTFMISEIAALPIADPDIPLLNAIIPVLFIVTLEIIISSLKNRSEKLKKIVEGEPCFIIYKGRICQDAMRENRLSMNELMCEARLQGIFDISKIRYAILEQNGRLSLLEKKSDDDLARAIIIDGEIREETALSMNMKKEDVFAILEKRSVSLSEIFLMTCDDSGKIRITKKDGDEDEA